MIRFNVILILKLLLLLSCSQPAELNSEFVHIPDEKFAAVIRIILNIESNQPIPKKDFQQLTKLRINPQREIIDLTGLEEATGLKELEIGDNYQIYDIKPLAKLKNLTTLGIFGNSVHDLKPLSELTHLKKLYINRNHIVDITPLAELTQLTELYIGENLVYDISPLAELTQLKKLTILDTSLADISPISDLTELTFLQLSDNNIRDITPIAKLTNLTYLDLQHNNISDTTPLGTLTKLKKLLLNDNPFTDISSLAYLKQLELLQIYNTNTADIASLAELTQLKHIDMHDTNVRYLNPLAESIHIRAITFYNTFINDITPIANLTELKWLSFNGTDISDLSPLSNLTKLATLKINENNISDISPLSNLPQLTELFLHKNQINDISPISGLTELTKLRLDGNNITDITPLAGMKQLEYLGLENNQIIDIGTLENFDNLKILHINGNPVNDVKPLQKLREKLPELNSKLVYFTSVYSDNEVYPSLPTAATARLGKGGINVIQFSPDGKKLVVGTDIGLYIYDVSTGRIDSHPMHHLGQVNAVQFSPDGRFLVSGGNSNPIVQVLDMHTGKIYDSLQLPVSRTVNFKPIRSVHQLAFSVGGTSLISLSITGYVTVWDLLTGRIIEEYHTDHDTFGNTLSINNDGSMFARGYGSGEIWLLGIKNSSWAAKIRGHKPYFNRSKKVSGILTLTFSRDNKYFASGSMDKTVRLWDTKNRRKRATFEGHTGYITALAFSNDSSRSASGDTDGIVRVWDIQNKAELATLKGHTNTVLSLAFSPDGNQLATASADGTIRFWNTSTWMENAKINGHTEWVRSVAFSEDGTHVSRAMFNNTVNMHEVDTGTLTSVFNKAHQKLTYAVTISSDATLLACHQVEGFITFNSAGVNRNSQHHGVGKILMWDLKSEVKLPTPANAFGKMVFSPNNTVVAASSSENINTWAATNSSTRMSSSGMSGDSKHICLWDVHTGAKLHSFPTDSSRQNSPLAFSHDGKILVSTDTFRTTYLWNVETREKITNQINNGSGLAFSPDGSMFAIRKDREIHLWQITLGQEVQKLNNITNKRSNGNTMTFSPDGKILLIENAFTGRFFCRDVQIRLYDIETGEKLLTLYGHTQPIETLVFSPDGKTLASGSEDGTVLLWDWNTIQKEIVLDSGSDDENR